jgi:Lon protease-like protein
MLEPGQIRRLGLFPLGLVALPGEAVPLHVFEPRYRALVADCALDAEPLVIALAAETGVARTGCAVRLDGLLRRFADGRMNIVVEGIARVAIVEPAGERPYATARVEVVPDVASDAPASLVTGAADRFRRLSEAVAGAAREPGVREGVPLSYAIAGAMQLDADVKQALLEERSEVDRLEAVISLLDGALAGLDRREVAAERASTNGKVTLS